MVMHTLLQRSVRGLVERRRASTNASILYPTWCQSFTSSTKESRKRVSEDRRNCLLGISGIGPKNLSKLLDSGITTVDDLKRIYKENFLGKPSDKMVEFLQDVVGIRHSNHAKSITCFVKGTVEEEELRKDNGIHSNNNNNKDHQQKRLTFCVEGNIGVGKTTFLEGITENGPPEMRDQVEVIPEPTSKWNDVGPDHHSISDAFYAWPQRYSYTFENYVFITRVMQEIESAEGTKPFTIRLMERSIFSDRMVFVRALHDAKWMNDMEMSIYNSWFDPVVSCFPGLAPDGLIYLRASPETCYKRMITSKRQEKGVLTLDYLKDMDEKLERWLYTSQNGNCRVLFVTCLPLQMDDNSLHPEIRGRVFYLRQASASHYTKGSMVTTLYQKVPVLILNCEENINQTKRQYIRQVEEFFKFVKKKRDQGST